MLLINRPPFSAHLSERSRRTSYLLGLLLYASMACGQSVITVFDQANFQGRQRTLTVGQHRLVNTTDLNDLIVSIRLPTNLVVQVFVNAGDSPEGDIGLGAWTYLLRSTPNLATVGFDRKISFLRVIDKNEAAPAPRTGYVWYKGRMATQNGEPIWLEGHWQPSAPPVATVGSSVTVIDRRRGYRWIEGDASATRRKPGYWLRDGGRPKVGELVPGRTGTYIDVTKRIPLGQPTDLQQPDFTDASQTDLIDWSGASISAGDIHQRLPTPMKTNCLVFARTFSIRQLTWMPSYRRMQIVVDTLKLVENGLVMLASQGPAIGYLKFIANVIISEKTPVNVSIKSNRLSDEVGDLLFSANTILHQRNLPFSGKLFNRPEFTGRNYAVRVNSRTDEQRFRNQWVTLTLQKLLEQLDKATDSWQQDQLFAESERVKEQFSTSTGEFNAEYREITDRIEEFFKDKAGIRTQRINGVTVNILVRYADRNVTYSLLPTRARLIPLLKNERTLLGTITVPDGPSPRYTLHMALAIDQDPALYTATRTWLATKTSIALDTSQRDDLRLTDQPFKLNDMIIPGTLLAISPDRVRCEVDLGGTEQQSKLIDLFKRGQPYHYLTADYTIGTSTARCPLALLVNENLLTQLASTSYAINANFDTLIETDKFVGTVNLVSALSPFIDAESGKRLSLDYLELWLETTCGSSTEKRGPFTLASQHATVGSRQLVRYIQQSPSCVLKLTGKAVYDRGNVEIDLAPLEERDAAVLTISESNFKTKL